MIEYSVTTSAPDDDANGIAESQTPGGAGSLTLDGALVTDGVAIIAEAQIITATWAGADAGRTLTVTFINADNREETGTIAGGNATTTVSTFYAKSISDIAIDAASAGAIEVGVLAADGMITKSFVTNWRQSPQNMSIYVDMLVLGATVSAQVTAYDPQDTYTNSFTTDANWLDVTDLTDVTADAVGNIAYPVKAVRFIQTVGTTTATFRGDIIQGQNG